MSFKIGDKVKFKEKVFKIPYSPYYDAYKDKLYVVSDFMSESPDHIMLAPLNHETNPTGFIHEDEIELFWNSPE